MGRGLRREIIEHNAPELPEDFVRYMQEKGKQVCCLRELAKALKEWQQKEGH